VAVDIEGEQTMRTSFSLRRAVPAAFVAVAIVGLSLVAPNAQRVAAQDSVTVDIVDFAFSQGSITIGVGTTVTWVNQGAAPHTATGDGGEFDTGQLAPGESGSITFDVPGTYNYHCAVHPDMTATIVVVAAADDGTTDDGATDGDTSQLPTTGTGVPFGGSGDELVALAALAALFLAFGAAAVRRRAI
jgi:plastocyanin